MKALGILIALCTVAWAGTLRFEDYFIDKTMRIDYLHIGHAEMELIVIDRIYQSGIWAGSRTNLIDQFNNGRYYTKVYGQSDGELIYSRGNDSYFGEYKLSDDGLKKTVKSYHESVLIPSPKSPVRLVIEHRKKDNTLETIFETVIDPSDWRIIREEPGDPAVIVEKVVEHGDPHTTLDLVILGEGYTTRQTEKFRRDLRRAADILLAAEPYHSYQQDLNIFGVLKPSRESGCDEPEAAIYKSTSLGATFNSLGSERYLLTEDNRSMRDIAGHVPYDAVIIMVNHSRYGGGGIYNSFCTFTSDNQWCDYILVHELGHSFAGLADEYYTSSTAYNDFYPRGIEPVEPNITALLDPTRMKWKDLLSPGIQLPTPWEKQEFDHSDSLWQIKRAAMNEAIRQLKLNRADQALIDSAIAEYDRTDWERGLQTQAYLKNCKAFGQVGAFEGAGYCSEGLYRPMIDCIMFSKGKKPYCQVCQHAVLKTIRHYLETE
ncbi:MAG: peptidase M64 [Candidatus Delongbacteria bacterium]|nr:peptidase M64 [Candidatus Delongbacteria bacterium]